MFQDQVMSEYTCICLALILLPICGCARQTQEVEVPSPEEAREALIHFCENASVQEYPNPDLKRMFSSRALLESLKEGGGFIENNNYYFESAWSYNLGNATFGITFDVPGGHKYRVRGLFLKDPSGKWRAEIKGYSHINTGPEKRPPDHS